ncbi:hypothetical protein I302_104671 [Kwoniella bestiolae CBS 10118]|uniref:Uncharacterized protein n=1 Tax=Kwoniella bestiolae CBS 10118 TaxID=1296100 RepID=A0A1B9FS39_9TREE|nr:hypothetical protein I302_09260 [Kwoniella bestiolae CBS 10118]OCF21581.1 hypothetical protein I302_09260 [Kwoniella bestiolae CBS 10118]
MSPRRNAIRIISRLNREDSDENRASRWVEEYVATRSCQEQLDNDLKLIKEAGFGMNTSTSACHDFGAGTESEILSGWQKKLNRLTDPTTTNGEKVERHSATSRSTANEYFRYRAKILTSCATPAPLTQPHKISDDQYVSLRHLQPSRSPERRVYVSKPHVILLADDSDSSATNLLRDHRPSELFDMTIMRETMETLHAEMKSKGSHGNLTQCALDSCFEVISPDLLIRGVLRSPVGDRFDDRQNSITWYDLDEGQSRRRLGDQKGVGASCLRKEGKGVSSNLSLKYLPESTTFNEMDNVKDPDRPYAKLTQQERERLEEEGFKFQQTKDPISNAFGIHSYHKLSATNSFCMEVFPVDLSTYVPSEFDGDDVRIEDNLWLDENEAANVRRASNGTENSG